VSCHHRLVIETKIKMIMTTNQQLELGFNGTQTRVFGRRRETRVARAQWWFAQMRVAVSGAMEWPANGQPPAQQSVIPGANRQLKA
jgi:hypothetical protein